MNLLQEYTRAISVTFISLSTAFQIKTFTLVFPDTNINSKVKTFNFGRQQSNIVTALILKLRLSLDW